MTAENFICSYRPDYQVPKLSLLKLLSSVEFLPTPAGPWFKIEKDVDNAVRHVETQARVRHGAWLHRYDDTTERGILVQAAMQSQKLVYEIEY